MYLQAGALVTTRDLVVGGTTIPAGTTLTSEQIATLRTLSSLLGNGSIFAQPDVHARRTKEGTPQPTYLNPGAYRALLETLDAAPDPEPEPAPEPDPAPEGE